MSAPAIVSPVALRTRDVADLATISGYPCISILLPTTPSRHMTRDDREGLDQLAAEVERRLAERSVMNRALLLEKLSEQVASAAAHRPTEGCAST